VSLAQTPADPAALQQQAYSRMEKYVESVRQTGDVKALASQLHEAGRELEASVAGFLDAGNLQGAAASC